MLLLGVLCATVALTALGLAMEQAAVLEARLVQQAVLDAQSFYTAEAGLALLVRDATRNFDAWEDATRLGEPAAGPHGCFPASPCGPAFPRRPAYATWAERAEGVHALRLVAVARAPGPAARVSCPVGGTGARVEQVLRRTGERPGEYTFTLSDWRHTPCPFSAF